MRADHVLWSTFVDPGGAVAASLAVGLVFLPIVDPPARAALKAHLRRMLTTGAAVTIPFYPRNALEHAVVRFMGVIAQAPVGAPDAGLSPPERERHYQELTAILAVGLAQRRAIAGNASPSGYRDANQPGEDDFWWGGSLMQTLLAQTKSRPRKAPGMALLVWTLSSMTVFLAFVLTVMNRPPAYLAPIRFVSQALGPSAVMLLGFAAWLGGPYLTIRRLVDSGPRRGRMEVDRSGKTTFRGKWGRFEWGFFPLFVVGCLFFLGALNELDVVLSWLGTWLLGGGVVAVVWRFGRGEDPRLALLR